MSMFKMSYYCFETTKNQRLANPYSQYSQPPYPTSRSEIVAQIIAETIDEATQIKIMKHTTLPLPELITPSVNVRTVKNPRPQNSFVIYRRNVQAEIAKDKGTNAAGRLDFVSKHAAKKWKQESSEVKELYGFLATCAKKVHDYMYPGYVYQPKRQATTNEPMIMVHEPGVGGYKLKQAMPSPPQTPLPSPPQMRALRFPQAPPQTQLPPLFKPQPMTTAGQSFDQNMPFVPLLPPPSSSHPPPSTLDISDGAISSNFMTTYDRSVCKGFDAYGKLL
ncbi:4089_t:CDS:1 [Acaulospora colombiana]|uniref:4089_t:CDS:1 n=1 Tax=Acaulospora colombiana TaxID=27376 RepID=A0ACA9M4L0_9GLOM|nr:4089_t:CDS:1 [Acaulospora colombiana]